MNQSKSEFVSIVMTAYNSEAYIAEAIESVFTQTHKNFELICVNDGSSDKTGDIMRSYKDRIIFREHEKNQGIGAGRNSGLAVARAPWVAFMDADDIWEPDKLERQLRFLHTKPELDMVFTYMKCFLSPDLDEKVRRMRYCPEGPQLALLASSVVVSRSAFDRVGVFGAQWRVGEFIDWFTRAKEMGLSYGVLPEVTYLRRIHNTNTGVTKQAARVDYVRIARAALLRRRSNP